MIIKNKRQSYANDLTDSQWELLMSIFPRPDNKSKWEKLELINAVLYLVDDGCKWRNLPHDFPPHTTVSNFYYAMVKKKGSGKRSSTPWANIHADRQYAAPRPVTR